MLRNKPSSVPIVQRVNAPAHLAQINKTKKILISAEDLVELSVCKPQQRNLVQVLVSNSVIY